MDKKLTEQLADLKSEFLSKIKEIESRVFEFEVANTQYAHKWYEAIDENGVTNLFYVKKFTEDGPIGFGWDASGEWYDTNLWPTEDIKDAKSNFVKEMLISEANKRGLTEGVYHNTYTCDSNYRYKVVYPLKYESNCGLFGGQAQGYIFKDGQWAEPKPDDSDGYFLNYKIELVSNQKNKIKIACQEISITDLSALTKLMKSMGIDAINHPDVGEVTLSKLEELRGNIIKLLDK